MLASLKEITLGIVTALCLYAIFGGYIAAMFNGKLPFMQDNEPARMCAVFQDGMVYGRDSTLSIDAYHEKTGQSFEMVECN
jgi:ABC-type long-subunit fatty acid transport system fused permease/ATPase subunit